MIMAHSHFCLKYCVSLKYVILLNLMLHLLTKIIRFVYYFQSIIYLDDNQISIFLCSTFFLPILQNQEDMFRLSEVLVCFCVINKKMRDGFNSFKVIKYTIMFIWRVNSI